MNPNQVPITLTLNIEQINAILDGMGVTSYAILKIERVARS